MARRKKKWRKQIDIRHDVSAPGTHVGVVVFRCPEPDLTTVEIDLTDVYENKQSLIDDIES
ncbi:MAG: hypothetical protein GY940_17630 [bacterium]|nr:hypothetical protein [bacterium]